MIAHITTQRAEYGIPVRTSCVALEVSESWYYKHRDGDTITVTEQRRERLTDAIWEFFKASDYTYGSPRVVLDLWDAGWKVSVNTVADIMAEYGWIGRERPKRRNLTKAGKRKTVPDLVARQFTAERPDQAWCGDVTYIPTGEGPMYLATVIDLYSRKLLGHAMSDHHDADLTSASLLMAIAKRGGKRPGTIFHSDRGGEYVAGDYAQLCTKVGVTQSMGRVACALDNSVSEALNSTLKVELVHRTKFATKDQARRQIGDWITNWYNAKRRHSWCGGISPDAYENAYYQDQQEPEIRSVA